MDLDVEALHDFPPLGAFVNLRCIHHPHTGASVILKVHLSPTPRCIRHPHQGASVTHTKVHPSPLSVSVTHTHTHTHTLTSTSTINTTLALDPLQAVGRGFHTLELPSSFIHTFWAVQRNPPQLLGPPLFVSTSSVINSLPK